MAFGLLSREEHGGTLTDEKSNLESATSWGVRPYGNRALFLSLVGHGDSWGEEALERHDSFLS